MPQTRCADGLFGAAIISALEFWRLLIYADLAVSGNVQ